METDCLIRLESGDEVHIRVRGHVVEGEPVAGTFYLSGTVSEVLGRRTSLDSLRPVDRECMREWCRCEGEERRAVA